MQARYEEARLCYMNGELRQAAELYIRYISDTRALNDTHTGNAYADLAMICHAGGNHHMAYELNEQSVIFWSQTEKSETYNRALCLSAVFCAYCKNWDEALLQLRYAKVQTQDTSLLRLENEYTALIRSHQLPVLEAPPMHASEKEIYTAVETIKFELYKKPQRTRIVVMGIILFICSAGVYLLYSNVIKHLSEIRKKKKEYRQQQEENITLFCEYLKAHPEALKKELYWNDYPKMCAKVNMSMGNLIDKLAHTIMLNETEIRLCVLVLIGLPRNQIAEILPYAVNSIGKLKNTTSKKLGTNGKNLHTLLKKMSLSSPY